MNKVLNKEVKKASEDKFARRQALFSNFEFEIEHIQGIQNCIPEFLSREHLHPSSKRGQVKMVVSSEHGQVGVASSEHGQASVISSDPDYCMVIVTEWKENQEVFGKYLMRQTKITITSNGNPHGNS